MPNANASLQRWTLLHRAIRRQKGSFRFVPTNKIPVSWPYDHKPGACNYGLVDEALQYRILEALKEFEIKFHYMNVQRLSQRGVPETEEDTIVIGTRDTDTTRWQEATNYIYGIVKKAAARIGTTMNVEIENPFGIYSDLSSPIMPDTAVHRCFSRIQSVVEAEVRRNCPDMCTSIAYHNRQHKVPTIDNTKQPTVIIFVAPGSYAYWAVVEAQIRQSIEAVHFKEDVEIALEILPGFNIPSATERGTTSCHPKFLRDQTPAPTLGASVGPQLSTTDSGSLGAVVSFQPRGGGEPQKCFLTAYHVVASGDPTGRAVNDEFGIGLDGRKVSQRIKVTYPARCDIAAPDQNPKAGAVTKPS
ncbi:hypothetical protein V502_04691 [Pseudogymnoascus sp. VKM F-4520 (FW-2644)]|nr:hypothetical protein V502_04691 [Pseudogymnoascus sp. VKM F-4520 (FW-2644)]